MAVSSSALAVIAAAVESFALFYAGPEQISQKPISLVFAVALLVKFVALGIYNIYIYPYFLSPLRHLPGVKGGLPIFGRNLILFEKPPGQTFTKWFETIPNDGLIHFHGLFNKDMLLPTTPAALAEILVTKSYMFQKPENGREVLREVLGDGLVVVEGDAHKFQRKNLMPTFSFRHIKDLYPMMWSKAQQLASRVEAQFDGEQTMTIDIVEWATKVTLDMIGVAGLGHDFNTLVNTEDELASLYSMISQPSPMKHLWFAMMILFGPRNVRHLPIPMNKQAAALMARIRAISRDLVRNKKEAITKHGDDHYDILSVLIKSANFADEELVDQMLTFLGAGHDTTSLTFTWTCFVLAKHPHIQERLRQEVAAARAEMQIREPDDGHLASLFESLPYLNGVFHEVLRLYPTVPMTLRVCTQETTIVGTKIPVGTSFIMSMMAVNRSPAFWGPDAAEFKPERWIDATTGKPNNHGGATSNYSLLTFLSGPRSCIGQNFARAELRCLLSAWILKYKMELPHPNYSPLASGAVTMKPMGGMQLKLTLIADKA